MAALSTIHRYYSPENKLIFPVLITHYHSYHKINLPSIYVLVLHQEFDLERNSEMNKKLYRSVTDKMLGGVCGGIAEYFGIDPVIIRLTFVLAVIFGGSGILAYIILWIIIPQKPYIVTPFNQENKNDDNLHNSETENKTSDDLQSNKFRKNLNNNKTAFAGIFLIVLGVIILLSNFVPGFYFKDYWPVVLIFLGSAIIYKAKNNKTNEVI